MGAQGASASVRLYTDVLDQLEWSLRAAELTVYYQALELPVGWQRHAAVPIARLAAEAAYFFVAVTLSGWSGDGRWPAALY